MELRQAKKGNVVIVIEKVIGQKNASQLQKRMGRQSKQRRDKKEKERDRTRKEKGRGISRKENLPIFVHVKKKDQMKKKNVKKLKLKRKKKTNLKSIVFIKS